MEADGACIFELELILVLQHVSDGFWVLGSCGNVINIDANVLVDIAIALHPDVLLCLAGLKSHVMKAVNKAFVPAKA